MLLYSSSFTLERSCIDSVDAAVVKCCDFVVLYFLLAVGLVSSHDVARDVCIALRFTCSSYTGLARCVYGSSN